MGITETVSSYACQQFCISLGNDCKAFTYEPYNVTAISNTMTTTPLPPTETTSPHGYCVATYINTEADGSCCRSSTTEADCRTCSNSTGRGLWTWCAWEDVQYRDLGEGECVNNASQTFRRFELRNATIMEQNCSAAMG